MQEQQQPQQVGHTQRRPQGLPANAILEQTEATHQRLYHLMGEPLLVRTDDPLLLEVAEEAFAPFSAPRAGSQSPPLVMELFVHDLSALEPTLPKAERRRPLYRTHGHLYYVSEGYENTAVVDLLRGYAFGFVSPSKVRDRSSFRYTFLEGVALAMLGPARQFIPLHAACVVKEGVSAILLGAAGSGKSTLAYACVRKGYRLLAEDGLMVKCQPDGPQLWGMPWKLHLLPDAKRFFPELKAEQPKLQVNGEWKLEVRPEEYHPSSTAPCASPGQVVFLERGKVPGPTRVEPVALQEALEQLEIVWPWWVGWTERMDRQLPRLLEKGRHRLWMNGTPDEAVDSLDALLGALK